MEKNEPVRMLKTIKSVFISWDFVIAAMVTVLINFLITDGVKVQWVKEILGVAISVLAVVFSVFFAALAVLITAGDNEFVRFLQEDGSYQQIVWSFRFTLILLFSALILSIVGFIAVLPYVESPVQYIFLKWVVLPYTFIVLYALFAAANASMDAIKYAEFRAKYLEITRDDE